MTDENWIERRDGYFFPKDAGMSSAMRAKLRMLIVEGAAEDRIYGVLIPFAKSVLLSEADAELLKLPPHNPYRLSIRTTYRLNADQYELVRRAGVGGSKGFAASTEIFGGRANDGRKLD